MTRQGLNRILALFLLFGTVSLQAQSQKAEPQAPVSHRIDANVIYGMYSGLALLMDVHHPAKPNGYGVILIPGSGFSAPLAYNAPPLKNDMWPEGFETPLLNAGYTIFAIDHRASPRFHYPAALEDAQRAVRFIRYHAKEYGIKADRIGGVGGSSGANLVSLLAVLEGKGDPVDSDPVNRESARIQCVVAGATPADLTKIKNPIAAIILTAYLGVPVFPGDEKDSDAYNTLLEASPIHYVTRGVPPIMFFHGEADTLVPIDQVQAMDEALRQVGVPEKLVRIPGGMHDPKTMIPPGGPDFRVEMIRWFDQFLRQSK
jgi:acetyl esterase/lipase